MVAEFRLLHRTGRAMHCASPSGLHHFFDRQELTSTSRWTLQRLQVTSPGPWTSKRVTASNSISFTVQLWIGMML